MLFLIPPPQDGAYRSNTDILETCEDNAGNGRGLVKASTNCKELEIGIRRMVEF